jgi:SpoVK/Ycf46/Vps4 family AAA+-type ATPase
MTPEDWAQLVRQSEDFSGAEIETVVRQAINIADTARPKVDDNAPTFEELLTAVERVQRTCVAKVAPKEIAGMREWGRDRAMSIYVPEEVKPGIFAGRRGGRGISTN